MGIDILNLVTQIERSFSIRIPDRTIQTMSTVGELHEFILSKTPIAPVGTCLTASAFIELESGTRECGILNDYGPSTDLEIIIQKQERRQIWKRLAFATDLELPNLVRPTTVFVSYILSAVLLSLGAMLWLTGDNPNGWQILGIYLPALALFLWLGSLATRPFATEFGHGLQTFRDLSERILVLNTEKLTSRHGKMGRNDTWLVLKSIIIDVLGVDDDEITRDADNYRDLGCS
jgi:acyl carrier protein